MPEHDDREAREALARQLNEQHREDQRRMDAERVLLAEKRAVERERIDNRLNDHDRQLRELVTQVGKLATGAERFEDTVQTDIQHIKASIHDVKSELSKRDAVSAALAQAVHEAGEKAVSTRAFAIGVGMLLVAVVTLFISSGHVG